MKEDFYAQKFVVYIMKFAFFFVVILCLDWQVTLLIG